LGSVMVIAIIDILYMWSETLSGCFTFLYTQPVRGTLYNDANKTLGRCNNTAVGEIKTHMGSIGHCEPTS
jgi:hypothetical protein